MLCGGRNTANKHYWHVWGVLAAFQPHWVCPHSRCVCFHVLTSQALGCSVGNCLRRDLGCVHFPGLSRSGSGSRVLGWACVLCPSQVCSAQETRCLVSAVIPMCVGGGVLSTPPSQSLSFLGVKWERLRCAMCLFWVADL